MNEEKKDAKGCERMRGVVWQKERMGSESVVGCGINVQVNRSSLGNAFKGSFYFNSQSKFCAPSSCCLSFPS